jgi:FAD/FMN-containing dehydrogenase
MEGKYGMVVDNMVSARLATAEGKCFTASSAENPDLWWGLRRAGHGFGIVSSLTVKAYPQINEG